MSDLQTFGPVVIPTQIGDAIKQTMQTWMPTYCAWISRQIGQDPTWLPAPKSYVVTDDPDHWPEDEPPAVVIVVSDTSDVVRYGNRGYDATWNVGVATYVTTNERESTERLGKYYAAAIRQLLLQKGTLGDVAQSTEWRGERYDYKTHDLTQRTLGMSEVNVAVNVAQVAHALGGPVQPLDPNQVPPDLPEMVTITVRAQGPA